MMDDKTNPRLGLPIFTLFQGRHINMRAWIYNWITCLVSALGNTVKVGNFLFWNLEAENCSANFVPVTLLLHSAQIGRMSRGRGETGAVADRTRSV